MGIKVITDAMLNSFDTDYNIQIIRSLSEIKNDDIVIPYGPKETFDALRKGYNVPISLMVDYHTLSLRNKALFLIKCGYVFNKNILKALMAYIYYYFVEMYIYTKCSNFMFVSQSDINAIKKRYPHNNYYCVPNGVNLPQENEKKKKVEEGKLNLGILSGWSEGTFLEAKWFIDDVWPKILSQRGNVELVICGKYATNDMIKYFNSQTNVRFIGEVENLSDFFNKIDIYLATKTIGCGILNKVLDAMSYRKLVIGVEQSFTGFSYMKDAFIVCRTVNDYVSIIDSYLERPEAYESFINNAYKYLMDNNNWEKNYKKFIEQLKTNNVL
jgi:glycosyltransferase involved in cell wall biosynthesis